MFFFLFIADIIRLASVDGHPAFGDYRLHKTAHFGFTSRSINNRCGIFWNGNIYASYTDLSYYLGQYNFTLEELIPNAAILRLHPDPMLAFSIASKNYLRENVEFGRSVTYLDALSIAYIPHPNSIFTFSNITSHIVRLWARTDIKRLVYRSDIYIHFPELDSLIAQSDLVLAQLLRLRTLAKDGYGDYNLVQALVAVNVDVLDFDGLGCLFILNDLEGCEEAIDLVQRNVSYDRFVECVFIFSMHIENFKLGIECRERASVAHPMRRDDEWIRIATEIEAANKSIVKLAGLNATERPIERINIREDKVFDRNSFIVFNYNLAAAAFDSPNLCYVGFLWECMYKADVRRLVPLSKLQRSVPAIENYPEGPYTREELNIIATFTAEAGHVYPCQILAIVLHRREPLSRLTHNSFVFVYDDSVSQSYGMQETLARRSWTVKLEKAVKSMVFYLQKHAFPNLRRHLTLVRALTHLRSAPIDIPSRVGGHLHS